MRTLFYTVWYYVSENSFFFSFFWIVGSLDYTVELALEIKYDFHMPIKM